MLGNIDATREQARSEWESRRKSLYHDNTPPPDEFKTKLYGISAGAEHCAHIAHEVSYVLQTCCGYHHSHVTKVIGDSFTFVTHIFCSVSDLQQRVAPPFTYAIFLSKSSIYQYQNKVLFCIICQFKLLFSLDAGIYYLKLKNWHK